MQQSIFLISLPGHSMPKFENYGASGLWDGLQLVVKLISLPSQIFVLEIDKWKEMVGNGSRSGFSKWRA
jgi:hypothetical protein